MLTRVSLVQGPSQLIDLLTVLRYRRDTEREGSIRDVLLIGGTCGSVLQSSSMTAACKRIAPLWPFAAIADVHYLEWLYHGRILSFTAAAQRLRRLVGRHPVSEVLVCRNTQLPNELVLNAFPDAKRLCYGDCGSIDLGCMWGDRVHSQAGIQPIADACVTCPRVWKYTCVDGVAVHVMPPAYYLGVIADASKLPRVKRLLPCPQSMSGRDEVLVLTSNLTEAGVAPSLRHEVECYRESVRPLLSKAERVVIKGHPREKHGQAACLQELLRREGWAAVERVPSGRIPIDLLTGVMQPSRVIALGSNGSLPFALRHHSEVVVGLDTDLEQRFLKSGAVNGVDGLNSRVYAIMTQQAFLGRFSVVRYEDVAQMPWPHPPFPLLVKPSGVFTPC